MKYELVWYPTREVIAIFDTEEKAWATAKNFIAYNEDEDFTLQDFDVNYIDEDHFGDKYYEDPY